VSSFLPVATMCGCMESKGTTCASSIRFGERTKDLSSVVYGSTSSPVWKRGHPLAPVVGEGQVNLGVRPWLVSGPWSKSPKLCG